MPEPDLVTLWAEAAARGLAVRFLREAFGPANLETVERLKDLLDRLSHRQPAEAVERARELVEYADEGQNPQTRVVARLALANAYLWSERLADAEATYQEARRLAEASCEPTLAARCGVGMIGVLFRQGRYQQALNLADEIEPALRSPQPTSLLAARVQSQRATLLQYLGRTEEAARMYLAAASHFRELGPAAALDLAAALHNAGLVLTQLGRYGEAAAALRESKAAAEAAGAPLLAARAGAAAAWTDLLQGRYAQALDAFERVAEAYAAAGVPTAAAAYRLFGLECWLYLGQAERVRQEGPKIAQELEASGLVAEAGRARYLAGLAHRQRGDWTAAWALLQQAYTTLAGVGRDAWRAGAACELASLRVREGDLRTALVLVKEAEQTWQRLKSPAGVGRALLVRSDALLAAQDLLGATEAARQALRTGQAHRLPWLCATAHRRLSVLRPEHRTVHLLRGVRWADRVLAWAPPDLRWGLFLELEDLYAQLVVDLYRAGRAQQAWEVVQKAKSRGMASLLASHSHRVRQRGPQDAHLVERLNRLLEAYRRQVLPEVEQGGSHLLEGQPELERQIQDTLWRLQIHHSAYLRELGLLGWSPRPALPSLEPHIALVEYFLAAGHVLAFVVDPSGTVLARRTCGVREVARAASLFTHGLRAYAQGFLPAGQALRQTFTVLRELYRLLIAPLEDQLARFPRLVVAPSGLLHGLPFHALTDGEGCMWDRWEVSYIPAGSLLELLRAPCSPEGPVVCVGDSFRGRFPGAMEEARWVAAKLGARLWEGPTPEELLDALRDTSWAHVASHCRFRPDTPLLSAIHLTAGPLTAADILASAPGCRVVVLSGCDTAASTVLPGDELMGFARAWFSAGAAALVLSLWPVEDSSTADFMKHFYEALLRGARLPQALREAALGLRATRPHPWQWAAFAVMGDPNTRLPKPRDHTFNT